MLKPYTHQAHKIKTSWLYVGIVCTDCQVSPPQSTDENKTPEFQTAYVDIEPKNILIFEKLKPKRHASFLNILSREKGLFVSSHVSVGLPERREVEESY